MPISKSKREILAESMTAPDLDLTIIIPSYHEELRLPATLEKLANYIAERQPNTEVIVVDDGSIDPTTAAAKSFQGKIEDLRFLSNGVNRGKGFSVRHGYLEASGKIILFTDADRSSPIEECEKLFAAMNSHHVAMGSRAVDRSLIQVRRSAFREFAGILFNKIVRTILRLPFVDTQCGFKAFHREHCRIIFEQQTIERFGFDPELLYLARHHGLLIAEVPVRWSHSPATKVSTLRDSIQMFMDVFVIYWNALQGRYRRET